MKFFVTGAFGYVGSAVAQELRHRKHELIVLARSSGEANTASSLGWVSIPGDLADLDVLRRACSGVDGVAHCAASDAPAFLPVNSEAIQAMWEGLQDGAAFVTHAGTLLFGPTGRSPHSGEGPLAPPPFLEARAKLDELIIAAGSRLRAAVVYAAMAYGCRGAAIPNAMTAAGHKLGFVPYPGDGEQIWSTVHLADWAALIADALERSPLGGCRYVAAGQAVSIRSAAEAAASALQLPARSANDASLSALGMFADALRIDQHFSSAAAQRLGWRASINDLSSGMVEAAALVAR